MCQDYYVYIHYKKSNGEPFYVGKGIKNRDTTLVGRNDFWHHVVNKHDYVVERVANNLTETEALKFEQVLIKSLGRRDLKTGSLVNLTDGGEGTSNPSEKTRALRIAALKGNKHSLGRVLPEWERKARSVSNLGKKRDATTRANLAKSKTGSQNPNFNPTIYKFANEDGRVFHGTQNELKQIMKDDGVKPASLKGVSGLTLGSRRQVAGWFLNNVKE